MGKREIAIEYFVKALSSGERSAAERLEEHLADDVTYETNSQPGVPPVGRETFTGRAAVLARVSGDWPITPMLARLGWTEPVTENGQAVITSSGTEKLTFTFDDDDRIAQVRLDGGWGSGVVATPPTGGPVDEIPLPVRGLINTARVNETPMVVTYVGDDGEPHSSFRGSVCVIGPTELGIWVRDPNGGLPGALANHPVITTVYSDFHGRGMITISGPAHVDADPEIRRRVYERSPEVEQTHDLDRRGVAVVIEVRKLQAFVAGIAYFMG